MKERRSECDQQTAKAHIDWFRCVLVQHVNLLSSHGGHSVWCCFHNPRPATNQQSQRTKQASDQKRRTLKGVLIARSKCIAHVPPFPQQPKSLVQRPSSRLQWRDHAQMARICFSSCWPGRVRMYSSSCLKAQRTAACRSPSHVGCRVKNSSSRLDISSDTSDPFTAATGNMAGRRLAHVRLQIARSLLAQLVFLSRTERKREGRGRHTQTHRHRHTQTLTLTHRHRHSQSHSHTDTLTHTQTHTHTHTHTHLHAHQKQRRWCTASPLAQSSARLPGRSASPAWIRRHTFCHTDPRRSRASSRQLACF